MNRVDVITVDTVGNVSVKNAAGAEVLKLNKPTGGRHLHSFSGSLMTSLT